MTESKKRTIGFPLSHKENEHRRALVPEDILKIRNRDCLYFERGYGRPLFLTDDHYRNLGCHVVSRSEVLRMDVICDPKIGDAEYLEKLSPGRIVFGWIHAVQNRDITDKLLKRKLTAYAWEDMFEGGRHIFWRNNEIAGEAAVMHAFLCCGIMPYQTKVALLGRGNIARGALKILTLLGADITVYDRKTEKLFKEELEQYDIIINAILWDVSRSDHIIYKKDLARLRPGAMIVDISCDRSGTIETSIPTTIDKPIYEVNNVTHYVVDHTPALFYKTASKGISSAVYPFLDYLIENTSNAVLQRALIINNGKIVDQRINDFQKR